MGCQGMDTRGWLVKCEGCGHLYYSLDHTVCPECFTSRIAKTKTDLGNATSMNRSERRAAKKIGKFFH
jgi:rRNA maturation endonuclease Nob1